MLNLLKAIFNISHEKRLADERGRRYREQLLAKYPEGLKVKVLPAHMIRLKVWDSVAKKYNSPWNFVAYRNNFPKPTLLNRLIWGLAAIHPIRWELWGQYAKLDDVYEAVFQHHVKFDGPEKFVLSLFPRQSEQYVGKRILIKKYGVVAHYGHRFLIGSDYEVYIQKAEIL